MPEDVRIRLDGRDLVVPSDITVAAALLNARVDIFRSSVNAEPRGPVCGMGVCYECRVRVDGVAHRRACTEPVREGMEVSTLG